MESNQKPTRLRIGSIAANCLLEILDTTNLFLANMDRPYLAFRYGLEDALEIRDLQRRASLRRAIRRLEKKELIRLRKVGTDYEAALTDEGVVEALRLQAATAKPLPKGVVCLVVFDVPMAHHRIRKQFRDFLKWAGFKKIQQSVWVSTKDACSALADLFRLKEVDGWVRIYRSIEIT